MRAILELIVTLALGFLAAKYGWPWPIFFVIVYLIAFGLRLSVLPRFFMVSRRFIVFLGLFLTIALFSIWGISEFLFWDSVQKELIEPHRILDFLLGAGRLKVLWSVIGGLAVPTLFSVLLLVPYGFAASQSIYSQYQQYRGHEVEAAYTVIAGLLGINRGTWVVSDGKAEVHGDSSGSLTRFGGPGILIVQEGHAVILEQSGRLTRVVGRGIAWLKPFERISMIVPLQTRAEKITVEQVATKDKIMIEEFEVLVFHKVDPGPEEDRVQDGLFSYNEDNLKRNVWSPGGGDWRGGVKSVSESAVRDVVGRYDLEEILPLSNRFRQTFKDELKEAINRITLRLMGVEVVAVDMGKVKAPDEARKRLMEKWLADWSIRIAQSEREAMIRKGEAEAVIMKVKEVAWAEAQKQIIERITEGFKGIGVSGGTLQLSYVIALRALETLEKMAGDPATKILLPSDVLAQLGHLRQVLVPAQPEAGTTRVIDS
jgi:regulator of protease activity HflC (stomatin/prohibitin superfamily)